jgi:hypothetical protein
MRLSVYCVAAGNDFVEEHSAVTAIGLGGATGQSGFILRGDLRFPS